METLVSYRKIEKQYGGDFALGPVSLELERGYIMALVGSNGAGKSTLFQMAMNMLKPDRGEVRLFGQDPALQEKGIKTRIGYVADPVLIHPYARTVGEAMDFYAEWYPGWDAALCRNLMERFELPAGAKLRKLSTGMKRRLALTVALSYRPELLLLDEPSSGLDPLAWRVMIEEIGRYMEEDGTILMASHNMDEVRRLADYVVFLDRGRAYGPFEKDALLTGWKRLWTEELPEEVRACLPGRVLLEEGPIRIVTDDPGAVQAYLAEQGRQVFRSQALELEEIMGCLTGRTEEVNRRSKGEKRA